MNSFVIVFCTALLAICGVAQADPKLQVTTTCGVLEGAKLESREGKPYYSFRGIPYAKFVARFKLADPQVSWTGVRQAKDPGPPCPQVDFMRQTNVFKGEEDCLHLSVYTPDPQGEYPVFFYIYGGGGGYGGGSADDFSGKYFMDEDVVVVAVNFRSGPFGFMTFNTGLEVGFPGNLGLKDQNMALQWVQKNIAAFGGDPTKVTMQGFSSGAAFVHMHVFSPMSAGLFRGAILRGGSGLAYWATKLDPRGVAKMFAANLSCPLLADDNSNVGEIRKCLESKTPEQLVRGQLAIREWNGYPQMIWGAVVEDPKDGQVPFLTQEPYQVLKSNKYNHVPMMMGHNMNEADYLMHPILGDPAKTKELHDRWDELAPIVFDYRHYSPADKKHASDGLKALYFPNWNTTGVTKPELTNLALDRTYIEPIDTGVRLHARDQPVFPFIITKKSKHSFSHTVYGEDSEGTGLGDALQYLFPGGGFGAPDLNKTSEDKEGYEFSKNFVRMLAGFVKNQKPTAFGKTEEIKPSLDVKPEDIVQYTTVDTELGNYNDPGRRARLAQYRRALKLRDYASEFHYLLQYK